MSVQKNNPELAFDKYAEGLMPVIVRDTETGEILMQAFANKEAVDATITSGNATFWSRSRNELWEKGKTSGDTLRIERVRTDCDFDSIFYEVRMLGSQACHVPGEKSCFHYDVDIRDGSITPLQREATTWSRVLTDEEQMLQEKLAGAPGSSYTTKQLQAPLDRIGQKAGEEGVEFAIAVAADMGEEKVVEEAADVLYRLQIALTRLGIPFEKVEELIAASRDWEIIRGEIIKKPKVKE